LNYYKLLAITLSPTDTPFWRRFWMASCLSSLCVLDDYHTYNEGPLTRDDDSEHHADDDPDWMTSEEYLSEEDGSTQDGSTDVNDTSSDAE
jgi:hypothetical protein